MRITLGFALLLVMVRGVHGQPLASKITAGAPDANYQTTLTGTAGAVEPSADVALVTVETGHYATARAAADGNFSASIFAPRGASILVKSDPTHAFVHRLAEGPPLAAVGEIPLFSSRADLNDPAGDPSKIDLWGYSYRSVQRPAVRVREQVTEDNTPSMYWRFHAQYGRQSGVGRNGDLPNDFKLQFGAAVLRGSAIGEPLYSIYGSLFVLIRNDDAMGTRAFPPFQGNGGGPTGGPLMTLLGKPVDIFFHPTGVRPGTVLDQGDTASFAGYSAPTLPSKITIQVTSPGGRVRTIAGRANKIGWFYDPGSDFAVDEPGVWKAKVSIVFDGVLPSTSGQLKPPYPTGDVLGSREGEFYFYVVRGDAASLSVGAAAPAAGQPGAAAPTQFFRPADAPITFTVVPPAGLTDPQLAYTTTMPGFVLEDGTASALSYTYDARRLAGDFPNLDLLDGDGFAGADTVTISFLLSTTDAAGKRRHFARQVVLQGEELQMPEQKATPVPRAAKGGEMRRCTIRD